MVEQKYVQAQLVAMCILSSSVLFRVWHSFSVKVHLTILLSISTTRSFILNSSLKEGTLGA